MSACCLGLSLWPPGHPKLYFLTIWQKINSEAIYRYMLNSKLILASQCKNVIKLLRALKLYYFQRAIKNPMAHFLYFHQTPLPPLYENCEKFVDHFYEKCSKFCIYYHPKWIKGFLTNKNIYIFTCLNNPHITVPFFSWNNSPVTLKIVHLLCEKISLMPPPLQDFVRKLVTPPTPPFWSRNICMLP